MGDRSGCTKLDRTNGYEGGKDYMRVKKLKLAKQNEQLLEALRNRNLTARTELFKGISINVNGRTKPTADELKRLILLNGGDYHPYYRYQSTKFMIATNLSTARIKQLRPDDRIVRPEWITDSIQTKCLLPYQDYQLFTQDELPSFVGTLNAGPSSSSLSTTSSSSSSSSSAARHRNNHPQKQKKRVTKKPDTANTTNCRDIRDFFKREVRC